MPTISLAASGDVQAYQIRAAPASTIAPGVVMASSPALPTQGATEEVTRKREVRLMKNRYEQRRNLCCCGFDLNSGLAVTSEISQHPSWCLSEDS